MKTCVFSLFLFFFTVFPVQALECSTTQGCYRPGAEIAGPDCSCPWIDGGDNSGCIEGGCPRVIDCQWSDWSDCSVKCGGGIQTRTEEIPAQGGGKPCLGSDTQTCNTDPCPWRRGECDTDIGEYTCTQVEQNEETAGQTTYETEEECREDADNKCKKNVIPSEYYEKVIGDCWQLTSYDWKGLPYQVTMGDVNGDDYLDLIGIDSDCNLYIRENKANGSFSSEKIFSSGIEENTYLRCESVAASNDNLFITTAWGGSEKRIYKIDINKNDDEDKFTPSISDFYSLKENWGKILYSQMKDFNNDGFDDLVLSFNFDELNSRRGGLVVVNYDGESFTGKNIYDSKSESSFDRNYINFGDYDGDGNDNDMIRLITDNSFQLMINKNGFGKTENIVLDGSQWKIRAVSFLDVDNNAGDESILVAGYIDSFYGGDHDGFLKVFSKIDNSWREMIDIQKNEKGNNLEMLNSVIALDFDNDGYEDIVAIGQNNLFFVKNDNGKLEEVLYSHIIGKNSINGSLWRNPFNNIYGDDFLFSGSGIVSVAINTCKSNNLIPCRICKNGDKSKGDANCDGKIDLVDFEIWRSEYLDIEDEDYDWQADFNCKDGLKKSDKDDFGVWIKNYFGVYII